MEQSLSLTIDTGLPDNNAPVPQLAHGEVPVIKHAPHAWEPLFINKHSHHHMPHREQTSCHSRLQDNEHRVENSTLMKTVWTV